MSRTAKFLGVLTILAMLMGSFSSFSASAAQVPDELLLEESPAVDMTTESETVDSELASTESVESPSGEQQEEVPPVDPQEEAQQPLVEEPAQEEPENRV